MQNSRSRQPSILSPISPIGRPLEGRLQIHRRGRDNSFLSSTRLTPSKTPRYALSETPKLQSRCEHAKRSGPLLASTQFNVNLGTYTDVKSPGLASRVVQYNSEYKEKPIPTHQAKYGSPGLFPVVHFFKKDLPVISPKQSRVGVKLSAPDILLNGNAHSLNNNDKFHNKYSSSSDQDVSTRSVLDALKEISRKRIHAGEEYEDDMEFTKKTKRNEYAAGEYNKRNREDSPKDGASSPSNQLAKRMCIVDPMYASTTSSAMLLEQRSKKKIAMSEASTDTDDILKIDVQTQTTLERFEAPKTVITESINKPTHEKEVMPQETIEKETPVPTDTVENEDDTKEDKEDDDTELSYSNQMFEIQKRKKLFAILGAITNQDSEALMETCGGSIVGNETKSPKSILSPVNKTKHDKHVHFNLEKNTVTNITNDKETSNSSAESVKKSMPDTLSSQNKDEKTSVSSNLTLSNAVPEASITATDSVSKILNTKVEINNTVTTTTSPTPMFSFGSAAPSMNFNSGNNSQNGTNPGIMEKSSETNTINVSAAPIASTTNVSFKFGDPIGSTSASPIKLSTFKGESKSLDILGTKNNAITTTVSSVGSLSSSKVLNANSSVASSTGTVATFSTSGSAFTNSTSDKTSLEIMKSTSSFIVPSNSLQMVQTFGSPVTTSAFSIVPNNTTSSSNIGNKVSFGSGFGGSSAAAAIPITTSPVKAGGFPFNFKAASTTTASPILGSSFTSGTPALPAFGMNTTPSLTFGTGIATTTSAPSFGTGSVAPSFGVTTTMPTFNSITSTSAFGSGAGFGTTTSAPTFGTTTSTPAFGNAAVGFGTTTPAPTFGNAGFGSNSTPAFGTTTTASSSFGVLAIPVTTSSSFGTTTASLPAFGASSTTNFANQTTTAGFGSTTTPAFGKPFGSSTSFTATTTSDSASPFGSLAKSPTFKFGGSNNNAPAFGSTAQPPAFGSTAPQPFGSAISQSFAATSAPKFSTSTISFGSTTAPSFGTTTAQSTFGTTTAQSTFGTTSQPPAFGTTAPSFGAKNMFGSTTTTNFGNTNTPFGSPTATAPAFGTGGTFGTSNPPPAFGSSTNTFGSITFGTAAPTTSPPAFGAASPSPSFGTFGPTTTNPPPSQTGVFSFGSSNAPTTPKPSGVFAFGHTEAPKQGGFNFGAGSTTTPTFGASANSYGSAGFGTAPANTPGFNVPGTQFNSPGAGMFNIGSGPTSTKRTLKAKRRQDKN